MAEAARSIQAVTGALAAQQGQYLTFQLGNETFAMGILHIKEIIEYGSLTSVPMMPVFIRGVINLRGAVVPVVDLAARFGRVSCKVTRRTCIVIIEVEANGERQDVGLVVDAVNEVIDVPAAEIEPPPAFGANLRTDFIEGMGKISGKFVIMLDVNRVLSFEDLLLAAHAGAAGEAGGQR